MKKVYVKVRKDNHECFGFTPRPGDQMVGEIYSVVRQSDGSWFVSLFNGVKSAIEQAVLIAAAERYLAA